MNAERIIIIADDLTGANDTAIQFVKNGRTALVVTDFLSCEPSAFTPYDVLSFNTDTRETAAGVAYEKVRNLIQRLKAESTEGFFYKKVDSVLRGNPGPELAAVMETLEIPLAVVAPSFPANRSVLEGGILKSGGDGQAAIDAVRIFADSTEKKVENIPLNIVRQGCGKIAEFVLNRSKHGVQVFVADAVTDEDLQVISRLSTEVGKPLIFAGAAALANQIARNVKGKQADANRSPLKDSFYPMLVVAGTRQGETAAQIDSLSDTRSIPVTRFKVDLVESGKSEEAIRLAFEEISRNMEKKPLACIVAVDSMFNLAIPEGDVAWNKTGGSVGGEISAALGTLAGKLVESFQFHSLITTGGDTTMEICKCLGVTGIEALVEICPGIPIGKIIGGSCEGRYIITKSGRFGNSNTLVEIFKYIENCKNGEEL